MRTTQQFTYIDVFNKGKFRTELECTQLLPHPALVQGDNFQGISTFQVRKPAQAHPTSPRSAPPHPSHPTVPHGAAGAVSPSAAAEGQLPMHPHPLGKRTLRPNPTLPHAPTLSLSTLPCSTQPCPAGPHPSKSFSSLIGLCSMWCVGASMQVVTSLQVLTSLQVFILLAGRSTLH